jgi:hypothetical protein
MPELAFLLPLTGGFLIAHLYSKVYEKLPTLKIKSLQLFPSVKIMISGKIFHLHHWFGFSILLVVSIFINTGLLSYIITKGILSGGIIQGLFSLQGSNSKLIYNSRSEDYTKYNNEASTK